MWAVKLCSNKIIQFLANWLTQVVLYNLYTIKFRSVGEWVTEVCVWLAGRWAWSKWACTGAARRLALHGRRGRRAGAEWKITAALTGGFEWGRSIGRKMLVTIRLLLCELACQQSVAGSHGQSNNGSERCYTTESFTFWCNCVHSTKRCQYCLDSGCDYEHRGISPKSNPHSTPLPHFLTVHQQICQKSCW